MVEQIILQIMGYVLLAIVLLGGLYALGNDIVIFITHTRTALADGKLTEDELELIVDDLGRIARTAMRIHGIFTRGSIGENKLTELS